MEKIDKNKNENSNKKKRRKDKLKRQVSIFTVMLWVFLISTMITITVNSTKKTNALEVEDENWNIQLVMYDRSSETPNEAITEFTWNAEKSNETKQLCMQINYACTTNKGYQPGEIEITIPGIAKDSFSEYYRNLESHMDYSYENWIKKNITIAADSISNTIKKYDWSYSYDEKNNTYIFINNGIIAENEHFEGTIQIVYNLSPKFRIQTNLEYKAKIKENIEGAEEKIAKESNICNFNYISNKKIYTLKKNSNSYPKTDYTKIEDILDDYYWVRYDFVYYANGIINAMEIDIRDLLPEECIMYDNNLNKLIPDGNIYYNLKNSYESLSSKNYYYVGYPKSKYNEGDEVTNTAELWGRYEDEVDLQKLAEASVTNRLIKLDFDYKGALYSIEKSVQRNYTYVHKNKLKNGGDITKWYLNSKVFYTDSKMDVEIGDDLLYITRENGELMRLSDDEYNFTNLEIPKFYTYNKYSGDIGAELIGYNYEVQVRYKNTNEYIVYKEGITGEKEIVTFDRDDIVGIKLIIKDLDKTLFYGTLGIDANIITKNCNVGKIYNFDYLKVYKKDEDENRILVNEPTVDSYKTPSTLKIAEYDFDTYSTYLQRDYDKVDILDGQFSLEVLKSGNIIENNVKEEKYKAEYEIGSNLLLSCFEVEKDVIIKQYDILPSGMNLESSKEEIIDSITSSLPYENLKLKDGVIFNTREELEKYIKENTEVYIDYNYRDSGRTKISIIYNLNEIDWSYYLINDIYSNIYVRLKTEIPYDSILEYGIKYTNYVYGMWNNQEYICSSPISDNGQYDLLASDIDNDGDTEEKVAYNSNILNITHAVSSQQAVIKQVRTDLTKGKFVEETAEATAGSEYTYKLRVTTGANSLKDLILYDTLETIYDESGNDISSGWKGKFLGVDTTYAESKGYAPKVYYSEEKNPGKLTEAPDKWIELTDDIDKSTVKSICVDLRYNRDGSEMELSPNNVVFVLISMQAPDDDTIITSANNMFSTNWRAKDPLGTVIDNVEGIYSNQVNVEIHKDDIRINISGSKTWNDLDNKYEQRPESITVKLLQDGVEYETKTVTAENNWQYTFENMPVYASNTRAYEYEIVEDEVQNYQTTYDGYNITNSIKVKDIEVTKVWEDNNNEANKRPNSIILQVFDGDKLITEAEVNEESEWKHTFTNLLKYREDGTEINYTVNEKSFLNDKFYTKEIVENTITNRFTVPEDKITITGIKAWNDNNNEAGKRPTSITLQVKANNTVVAEQVVNESNNFRYDFELAKYDRLGNEIEYHIDEKDTGNKFYTKEKIEKTSDTETTITNKFEVPDEKVNVEVIKIWNDNNNESEKRPDTVTLQVKDGEKVVASHVVNEEDEWKYTFTDLPKYDSLGNEITYTVDEEYTNEFYIKEIVGNTITNRFVVPEDKIKIVGTKVWDDSEDFAKKRPDSVILQVIANNEVITEHEVNESNNWSYEFELAKYDKYGNEIEYHIDERDVGSKFYKKELVDATTVKNTFKVPEEKINLEVMKTWDDNNNEAGKRPENITLQVKNNGVVVAEQVVSESENFRHTFELPKYNETGDEIEYTVDEKDLDGETSKFYVKNIVGLTITNKFVVPEDRVKIQGTKVWQDNGNVGGKRDLNVILQLKVEDNIISEAEVNDSNNWSYEFEAPKYDELGNEIEYYIDERSSDNKFYKKILTDKNTVTNEFVVPEEVTLVKAVKKWEDNNNEYSKRPESVILQVYDGDKLVAEEKVSADNNWSYEFKLPKYDELGDEIKYTVDEKSTSKYYKKSVEGYTVINKCIYEPTVDTSDMNLIVYVVIFFVAIIGVIVGILFVRKNNMKKCK